MARKRPKPSSGRVFPLHHPGQLLALAVLVIAVVGYIIIGSSSSLTPNVQARAQAAVPRGPQTTWAACNRNAGTDRPSTFTPLSDAAAAARITRRPEIRPDNAKPYSIDGKRYVAANTDVPSQAQLKRFWGSKTSAGTSVLKFNPYLRYVDGRDGLRHPSTDDLIQWAAHKWGIPENWLRAEFVLESDWSQYQLGDEASVSARWYGLYPAQARVRHSSDVFQSLGITQVKWIPDGSVGAGTEPLRWQSTAFNLDYQAATLRFYYDDPSGARSAWGDSSYKPCEQWNSLGGWYEPYPWGNSGQEGYVAKVQQNLADRAWTASTFVHWRPPTLPPGIRFR